MRKLGKILLFAAGALVLVFGIVWIVGASLPAEHHAAVETRLAADPATVWALVSDLEGGAAWRTATSAVHRLPDRDGRAVYEEETDFGPIRYEVVASDPPHRLVTRIVDHADFGGTWTYELAPDGTGTKLRITENGIITSPPFRFLARFVLGYDATLDQYRKDVERKSNTEP
jgi:uncharacterized protein YndB with AHSA1/START domain